MIKSKVLDGLLEPAREEVDELLGAVDLCDLTAEEVIALIALLRPIVDRVQAAAQPPAQLRVMRLPKPQNAGGER